MTIHVGRPVPDIEATYWQRGAPGPKQLSLSDLRGKWVVLFFYTRDFTYVCPTELKAFAVLSKDFDELGATVIGASTDSYFSHNAWFEQDTTLSQVEFPVIADTSHRISKMFGVLLDDGSALRGTFIIDPDGVLRHMSVNEIDVGRNVSETLRLLQALQSGELCRAGWRPGQDEAPRYNEWLAQVFPRLKKSVLAEATERLNTFLYDAGDIIIQQGTQSDLFY
ncbi:MAG: peroxiredoxin, partial [Aestuariivirgaceae bacterium]